MTDSTELEVLDQVLTGPMTLAVLRSVCHSNDRLIQAIVGLLSAGDIELFSSDGEAVPQWRWRELFKGKMILNALDQFRVEITDSGAERLA